MEKANAPGGQGTSINFDAQALHDAEEAEFQREEDERQNELKNLLTCAFDCDLSDEDSQDEDTSQDLSHLHHQHDSISAETGDPSQWHQQHPNGHVMSQRPGTHPGGVAGPQRAPYLLTQHASTPISGQAPPLLSSPRGAYTPYGQPAFQDANMATVQQQQQNQAYQGDQYDEPEHQFAGGAVHEFEGHHLLDVGKLRAGGVGMEGHELGAGHYGMHHGGAERGEVEGENEEDGIPHSPPTPTRPHHPQAKYPPNYVPTSAAAGGYHYMVRPGVYGGSAAPPQHDSGGEGDDGGDIYQPSLPPTQPYRHAAYQPPDNTDGYKVEYVKGVGSAAVARPLVDTSGVSTVSRESEELADEEEGERVAERGGGRPTSAGSAGSRGSSGAGRADREPAQLDQLMQKEFLGQEGTPRGCGGQFTQLEILYRARGNKIEELITELKQVRDDSDRQTRILKHKLTLVEDERDGLKASVEQSSELLTETRHREQALQAKVRDFETQLQALATQKTELLGKVEEGEQHIEALTAQLADLGTTEALMRTREQHEALVAGLRHKHDQELHSLRTQLDQQAQDIHKQDEELVASRAEAESSRRELEKSHVERGDTVNQLTRSLEQSQRQCMDLLHTGATQEVGKLKIQLQEALAAKSIAEDLSSGIQEEMRELKEQLTLYESASQYLPGLSATAAIATTEDARMDDSYAQLGIKKGETGAGEGADCTRADSATVQTMLGLRKELERCLQMYKGKREQLVETGAQLKTSKAALDEARQRLERTEKELKETKLKLNLQEMSRSGASSLKEVRLQKEMDKIIGEKETMRMAFEAKVKEYEQVTNGGSSSLKEAQLTKQLEKLNEEKQLGVMELEDIKGRFDEVAASEERLTEMNRELRAQMSAMVREYDEDKRQAIEKCQETCLQHHEDSKATLRQELEQEHAEKIETLSAEFNSKLDQLREDLKAAQRDLDEVKETYVGVCEEKTRLEEEAQQTEARVREQCEHELQQQLEQVEAAREAWAAEQEAAVAETVSSAVSAAVEEAVSEAERRVEEATRQQCDHQLQHQLQEAKLKWQTERRVGFERELQERLAAVREGWESSELPRAVEEARQAWQAELLGDSDTIEEKVGKAVSEAKILWKSKEKRHRDQSETKVRELSRLVVEVEGKVDRQNWELKQEVGKLRRERAQLDAELATSREQWAAEKQALVSDKDSEREKAVKEVREQAERHYSVFLEEHKDTLNNALKAARDSQEKEMEELKRAHEEEVASLRTKLEQHQSSQQALTQEKESAERAWQERLDDLVTSQRAEKEQLSAAYRDQLHEALEQARTKWQQEMNALAAEKKAIGEREAALDGEAGRLRGEVARLEALLQSADAHMEAEISKLHGELDQLHSRQLQRRVTEQATKVEKEVKKKLDTVTSEKSALSGKLEETRSLLKELENKYKKDTANLAEKARSYKDELKAARKELEEKWRGQESADSQRGQLATRCRQLGSQLESAERQLKEAERRAREAEDKHGRAERDYKQVIDEYKQQQSEHSSKIAKLELRVAGAESAARRDYDSQLESAEREHAATVEGLRRELADQRDKHRRAVETLRQEAATERLALQHEIDAYRLQQRSLLSSSTQTDTSSFVDEATLQELRGRYTRAVAKMKMEVMRHVNKANELAAETVKIEVLKERHKTAARMRKHYMRCMAQLLDDDQRSAPSLPPPPAATTATQPLLPDRSREEKLRLMEAALSCEQPPSAPSQASASTTRTNTPAATRRPHTHPEDEDERRGLKTPTPSDFTPIAYPSSIRSGGGGGAHSTEGQRSAAQLASTPKERRSKPVAGVAKAEPLDAAYHNQSARSSATSHNRERSTASAGSGRSKSGEKHKRASGDNATSSAVGNGIVLKPYYGKDDEHDVVTPTRTPAETPIEELLRQEEILKSKLARQRAKSGRNHKSSSAERNQSSGDYVDYADTHVTCRQSSGRGSDLYKSRNTFDASIDAPSSTNTSKRASLDRSSTSKHTSRTKPAHEASSSRHFDTSVAASDKSNRSVNEVRSHSLETRSSESIPMATPKKQSNGATTSYKYTSLRTNLNPSFAPLTKAASSSNIPDQKHHPSARRAKPFYDFPEDVFEGSKAVRAPSHDRDTESGTITPTELGGRKMSPSSEVLSYAGRERARQQRQGLSSSSGSSIGRPLARRSSSESRLPRPIVSPPALATAANDTNNNNNNCPLQSEGSSFERYEHLAQFSSPAGADSGIGGTVQATPGSLATSVAGAAACSPSLSLNSPRQQPQVTELRLSWESNPPQSFNIHTRYAMH